MTRPLLPLLTLAAVLAPLALADTKSYPAGDFTGIDTRGVIDVVFETGPVSSIHVEEENGDFSDIYIEQSGDTLKIGRNSLREGFGWSRNVSVKTDNGRKVVKVNGKRVPAYLVRIIAPTLAVTSVSNSSSMTATGLDSPTFSGSVSSSSDLILSGTSGDVDLRASSSGDLDASSFEALALKLDVSSSADALALVRDGTLDVDASSSADVNVRAIGATKVIVDASSSADVELSGTCQALAISASSSADVEAHDLKCATGDIRASSGADVSAFLTDSVEAKASSGADIAVAGNPPSRDVSKSSGGDIEING